MSMKLLRSLFAIMTFALVSVQPVPIFAQSANVAATVVSLLAANPNGGDTLAQQIANLANSNQANLSIIIAALQNANAQQQKAIGAGLRSAANTAAANNNAQYANEIQTAVASAGFPDALASYSSGNTQTAAVGSGNAGGAGGGGGGGTAPTSSSSLPTGGTGGGSSSGTGSTSQTASNTSSILTSTSQTVGSSQSTNTGSSVSPTR